MGRALVAVMICGFEVWGLFGCGRTDRAVADQASLVGGGSGQAELTWQPNVRVMEESSARKTLLGVNSDERVLLFANGTQEVESLASGDVLLIKGLLARKVLAVIRDGAEGVLVFTEPATLTDAVRDGEIHLDLPVRFADPDAPPGLAKTAAPAGQSWKSLVDAIISSAHAQAPDQILLNKIEQQAGREAAVGLAKGAVSGVFEGWNTVFSAVRAVQSRLNISITMTKNVGGFIAVIEGKGYLADFDMSSDILIRQGIVERLELLHKRLNGEMEFSWEVAKGAPGAYSGNDRIKLPAALSIPLAQFLGGMPLFLDISAAVIVQPAISGGGEYSEGSFRITYDGYQHFKIADSKSHPDGNFKGNVRLVRTQNISAVAPHGIVVAFAAPRIELSFGVGKILKGGDETLKKAASYVDKLANLAMTSGKIDRQIVEKLKSAAFPVSLGKAVENSLDSDAVGYVELVVSSGMSHTGMSVIQPCTRTDMHMYVKVGASSKVFGQSMGEAKHDVFSTQVTEIDPPSARLCESVGEPG